MAHEIERNEDIVLVGQGAWHNLGTVLDSPPTVEDAIRLAGLNWDCNLEPIYLKNGQECEEHKATVRSDNGRILGVVGSKFRPLQNKDAFAWFNPLLHEGNATIEVAGCLKGGKRIWVLCKLNFGEQDITKGDSVLPYILLAHGHDGSLAVDIRFTIIRVVCANTMGYALDEKRGNRGIYLRHTKNLAMGLQAAQQTLNLAKQSWDISVEAFRTMAKRPINGKEFRSFCMDLMEIPVGEEPSAQAKNTILDLEASFAQQSSSGTKWAAYNTITEWIDYRRSRTQETRLESTWYGIGAEMRERAMTLLTK